VGRRCGGTNTFPTHNRLPDPKFGFPQTCTLSPFAFLVYSFEAKQATNHVSSLGRDFTKLYVSRVFLLVHSMFLYLLKDPYELLFKGCSLSCKRVDHFVSKLLCFNHQISVSSPSYKLTHLCLILLTTDDTITHL